MAHTFKQGVVDTFESTGAVAQHRFITGGGVVCGAGEKAFGVSMIAVDEAGVALSVMVTGVGLVEAAGAITAGDEVESDADGKAVVLSTGKSNGVARDTVSAGENCRVAIR